MERVHVSNQRRKDVFICTYIGKLDRVNGVGLLIEASRLLPPNFKIHIYGNGEMMRDILEANSENLIYHGFVNPDNVSNILEQSDILLSPRFDANDFVKYSFPSKIFDYLTVDRPIITFKLPCYFKELDDVMIYLENDSPEEMANKIVENSINQISKRQVLDKIYSNYNAESLANRINYLATNKRVWQAIIVKIFNFYDLAVIIVIDTYILPSLG